MLQNLSEDVRDCCLRAADCAEKVKRAATLQLRSDFLRLEKAWLTLAHSYEFPSRLSDFNTDQKAAPQQSIEAAPPYL